MAEKSSLNRIELDLLGDVTGKSVLHLQGHFGQDTMSLSCMDARVAGMDLSYKAISKAKEIAHELKLDTQFVCSDVYTLYNELKRQFDVVFASYGSIGWLPDLKQVGSSGRSLHETRRPICICRTSSIRVDV